MKHLLKSDAICEYIQHISRGESVVLEMVRRETRELPEANMQISPEQGRFLALLVELIQAKKILELGTFTGYSSLAMAMAMPDDGRIITLDTHPEWTEEAQYHWRSAGVGHKIELRLGHALSSLDTLVKEGHIGTFDLVFIDADKQRYEVYYEFALQLLKPHGVVVLDNVLWSGRVADPKNMEVTTESLRAFNEKVMKDERVTISLLPLGDGLLVARKRQ